MCYKIVEFIRKFEHHQSWRFSSMLNRKDIECNINWLLSKGYAPVKYLTNIHLLKAAPYSREMRELWKVVEKEPSTLEIFSKQQEDGSWCTGGSWSPQPSYIPKGGYSPVSPKYVTTVWKDAHFSLFFSCFFHNSNKM